MYRILAFHSDFLPQTVVAGDLDHFFRSWIMNELHINIVVRGLNPLVCGRFYGTETEINRRGLSTWKAVLGKVSHHSRRMATQEDLESRLKAHSAYFTSMVELIPAKFYVMKDEVEQSSGDETDSKFWVNKRSKAPKQAVKEATKKAKQLKFDPSSHKVSEATQKETVDGSNVSEGADSSLTMEEQRDVDSDDKGEGNVSKRHPKAAVNGFSVEQVQSGDLNDLRERLHNKIAELRGKRKLRPFEGESSSGGVSQKRQKVVEKRQRKKELRKKGKERKHVVKHHVNDRHEGSTDRPSIKDESGHVVFSKFDFGTTARHFEPKAKTKDYQKLLAKAEVAQKRLEELKKTDEKKGEELQEKLQWQRAVDMAKGTKLKDDTKLLKRTVKRLDSKKTKNRKQWLERQKQERLAKEKRQEKRKKNIQERIEQVKAKKIKRGKPRKPGF